MRCSCGERPATGASCAGRGAAMAGAAMARAKANSTPAAEGWKRGMAGPLWWNPDHNAAGTRLRRHARIDLNHGAETASGRHWPLGGPLSRIPTMRMDKLTSRFQQALADAQSLAVGRDHNFIEPAHLLVALLDQQGGGTRPLLAQAGVNVPVLRERLGEILERLPKVSGQAGNVSVGNDLARLLNVTDKLAQQRGDAYIASELFLLAALEDGGDAGRALKAAGASKQK